MQDTQPEEKLAGSNEISLIDILAVLLRSRRLIVGTTALALVLAILAVVLIPSIVLAKTSIDKIYEAVVSTRISSSVLVFVSQELVDDFLQQSLSEPTIILAALREAGIEKIDTINLAEQNEDQLLFSIRRRLVENRAISGAALPEEQRLYTTQTAKGGFQVSINYPDPLLAKNFLLALIQHTNIRMTALVYPMAEAETYSFEKIAELESQTQNLNKEHAAFYQLLKNRMEPNCPPVADVRMKELEKKMDKLNEENVKMREVLVGILNSDRRSAAATTTSAPPAVLEDSGKTGWMDFSLPSPNHMRGEIRFSTDKIREPNLPLPEPHPIAPGVDLPISTKALWWGAVFVVILLLLVIAAAIFWGRKRRALPRRAARVEPPADDRD